ncbi:hypothetical protein [Desulfatibacillum aliphaticivorans]|uniref:hypothetical protein n=1 Tax=Desulfatibacillum aliphaticivorans TaxID=218208 RepID=UPI000404CA44|nr:hypothetical protein [Desulfatibacillum aliphaticivorans]
MEFWILGAGKFGRIALERLRKKHPDALIKVVDSDAKALAGLGLGAETLVMPGADFLLQNLDPDNQPDWIVPAIPVHMAFDWLLARLQTKKPARQAPVPREIADKAPNPMWGENGTLYVSQADFLCPDNCPEPEEHCFKTGLPRDNLFDMLARMDAPGSIQVVIRSHQLTPGVGGIKPDDLFNAEKRVVASDLPVHFSTACRCHGVINRLEFA